MTMASPPFPSVAAPRSVTDMIQGFPLKPGGLDLTTFDAGRTCGACDIDAEIAMSRATLECWRISTGVLVGTVPVGGADLTFELGESINLFDRGIGDPDMVSQGYLPGIIPSLTETDTFQNGTPTDLMQSFYAFGMAIYVGNAFRLVQDDVGGPFCKVFDPQMEEYNPTIHEAILNGVSVQYTYGNSGCAYTLGPPALWGTMSANDDAGLYNGVNGLFHQLRIPTCNGARDTTKKLTVIITVGGGPGGADAGMCVRIGNNSMNPIVDPQQEGATQFFVPIRMQLIGLAVPAFAPGCGTVSPDTVAQVVAALRASGQLGPGRP